MKISSIVSLRYHEFIPRPYLEFGARLLRNGVDRSDAALAAIAALKAAIARNEGVLSLWVPSELPN